MALAWAKPGNNFAEFGGDFSLERVQTIESGPHVNEIIDSSRTKARAMVDAAMQVITFNSNYAPLLNCSTSLHMQRTSSLKIHL